MKKVFFQQDLVYFHADRIIFWGDLERFAHFFAKNLIEICLIGGKISYKNVNFAKDLAKNSG